MISATDIYIPSPHPLRDVEYGLCLEIIYCYVRSSSEGSSTTHE